MLKKQKPPERSDFPPDAEVYLPNHEENSIGMILFSILLTVMCGIGYMTMQANLWLIILFWLVLMILLFLMQRQENQVYTVIYEDRVEFRSHDSSRIVRFRWDEIDSYREISTRFGPQLKLYSGGRAIKLPRQQMPGGKRLEELVKYKNLPPHFPRGSGPESFRVGLFLRVEGDKLIRQTLFGRKECPLSELHVRRPLFRARLCDRSGKCFVRLPLVSYELMHNFDLLKWALEHHGVNTKLLTL